jgi:thioredoxin-related protein
VLFGAVLMGAEIYFLFLMASVLQVYCPLCLGQFTVVLAINILLFATVTPDKDKEKFRATGILVIAASFLVFFVPHKMTFKGVEKRVESITSWGDSSSKYRMEVFSDYQCGHCKKFDVTIKDVIKNYPQVYIVFRDMILPRHNLAPMAISYAGSVAYYEGQEMYLKARFEIFENQKNLFNYIGPRFEAIRDDAEMKNAVKVKLNKDFELAKSLDIRSTPTTILVRDGRMVLKFSGNRAFAKLKPDLDKLVSR